MALFCQEEFGKLKEILILYRCALNNMEYRVETLLEDYTNLQAYNPIEHVKSRLKSPESIAGKLERRGRILTAASAVENLTDIAGIRCICSYAKDIKYLADVFMRQPDIRVIEEKDYVSEPKPTGYRSFHLIMEVPIYLTNSTARLPVEVQIRTQAMDFWASLEHKVRYKYNDQIPEALSRELIECANKIQELDDRMYLIQEIADLARSVS